MILQNPTDMSHFGKKCVRKSYLLITSTFITKVLSNLQADGHDLVIAAFVRVPESTQNDSRAELRIFLTTENSVLQQNAEILLSMFLSSTGPC